MTLPHEIEAAALIGWRMYPCSRTSRAGCIKSGTDLATNDLNQLTRWATEFPGCNWRVVMSGSGIFALDCDVPPLHSDDGISNLSALVKVHGDIPERPMVRSGSGGLVLFFRHSNERIVGDGGHPAAGIDPRRGRQSQTIPPSRHHITKRQYRWITPPWLLSPPPAPSWLLRLIEPPPEPPYERRVIASTDIARSRLYRAASAVMQAGEGKRNDVLNRRSYQAGTLIASGLVGEQEAVDALYGAARQSGLDPVEIKATIRSGIRAGLKHPAEIARG